MSEAGLPSATVDVVYSVSVIEHLSPEEIRKTTQCIGRVLKPGGLFVAIVDLFLNLSPFTSRQSNQWGKNVSILSLVN